MSAKNAMPEEKKAKENQSENVPLHQLIKDDSTLRALKFLTAFFSFAEEREREERELRTFSLLSFLPSSFAAFFFFC
jgi:hypothetical protein